LNYDLKSTFIRKNKRLHGKKMWKNQNYRKNRELYKKKVEFSTVLLTGVENSTFFSRKKENGWCKELRFLHLITHEIEDGVFCPNEQILKEL